MKSLRIDLESQLTFDLIQADLRKLSCDDCSDLPTISYIGGIAESPVWVVGSPEALICVVRHMGPKYFWKLGEKGEIWSSEQMMAYLAQLAKTEKELGEE